MEDVIFGGSDARKPTAAAEVRLKLSGVAARGPGQPQGGNGHKSNGHGHSNGNGNGNGQWQWSPHGHVRPVAGVDAQDHRRAARAAAVALLEDETPAHCSRRSS
jgi:hypothetical protein